MSCYRPVNVPGLLVHCVLLTVIGHHKAALGLLSLYLRNVEIIFFSILYNYWASDRKKIQKHSKYEICLSVFSHQSGQHWAEGDNSPGSDGGITQHKVPQDGGGDIWKYWPVIGQYKSCDLNTDLWLQRVSIFSLRSVSGLFKISLSNLLAYFIEKTEP